MPHLVRTRYTLLQLYELRSHDSCASPRKSFVPMEVMLIQRYRGLGLANRTKMGGISGVD